MTPTSDVALAPFTTMNVGGPARWFIAAASEGDVRDALAWANDRAVHVYVLGGGSNVVVADDGLDGLVIHISIRGVEHSPQDHGMLFRAGAGELWDEFVKTTVNADCAGVECLSGIPGLIGGTPVQNVGAYGQDVSRTIARVRVVDRVSGSMSWMNNAECAFGYRTSRFKREDLDRYIVTRVEFELAMHAPPTVEYADVVKYFSQLGNSAPSINDVRDAVLAIRRRKGMVIEAQNPANHSCGSFFVNPVVSREHLDRARNIVGTTQVPHYVVDATRVKVPAAWLIEQAGFPKGTLRGTVGVSPFQAQAIVNLGRARAADVLALAAEVKRAVWNMFGISIVPEPVFLGFVSSPELRFLLAHQGS